MNLDEVAAVLQLEGCPLSRKQYAVLADLQINGNRFSSDKYFKSTERATDAKQSHLKRAGK